jgi:16S rRNA (cytosine1402-N4)-methyltransferase
VHPSFLPSNHVRLQAGKALAEEDRRFEIHKTLFGDMRKQLPKALRGKIAGVLLDLGISSPQLDDPA